MSNYKTKKDISINNIKKLYPILLQKNRDLYEKRYKPLKQMPQLQYIVRDNFILEMGNNTDYIEKESKEFLANLEYLDYSFIKNLEKKIEYTLGELEVYVPYYMVYNEESERIFYNGQAHFADDYVGYFKERLKTEALKALDDNRKELDKMQADYKSGLSDKSTNYKLWARMEVFIEKDKNLYNDLMFYKRNAESLRSDVFDIFNKSGIIWFNEDNGEYRLMQNNKTISMEDRSKVIGKDILEKLNLMEAYNKQMIEITAVRRYLREIFPALAVFDPEKVKSISNHSEIYKLMCKGFDKAREAQEQVKNMVLRDKLPINKIEPIKNKVLEDMAKDKTFNNAACKYQVYKYLDDNKKSETIFRIIGMSVSIIFMAVAFFASGGVALVFGLAAAAVGLGMGAYELSVAGEVKELAEAQKGGTHLLINQKDADSANFNYAMAWVDVFLSALDVAMSVKAFKTVIKANEAVKALNNLKTLDDIPKLKASEIYRLKNMSKEEVMEILENYRKSSKRNIDKIAELFKARSGRAMSKEEIIVIYKSNKNPPKVLARISTGDYTTLSGKELAWLCDPAEVQGLTNVEIMKRIGWEDSEIQKVLSMPIKDRPKLKIKLVEDPGNLRVPSWDEIEKETKPLLNNSDFIKDMNKGKLDINKIDDYIMTLKKTPIDKIINLEPEVKKFRKLLEKYLGNNKLFSNKGFTITPDGKFGLREWILSKPDFGWELSEFEKSGFKVDDIDLRWE